MFIDRLRVAAIITILLVSEKLEKAKRIEEIFSFIPYKKTDPRSIRRMTLDKFHHLP